MTKKRKKDEMEEFKYLIDSRTLSKQERKEESEAILKAREARFRARTEHERKVASLLQLKYQMEEFLKNPVPGSGSYFTKFLNFYVDTLYKKRKDFASDLSIDPIVLSQVLNNHRDPQETFMHRLIIHTRGAYEKVCEFNLELWPRVFYQDKVHRFLSTQHMVRESEEKYVTTRGPEPQE
ncbi:MAG: hypothetical protein V2B15_15420, partial [Bacteroidota bacterium]